MSWRSYLVRLRIVVLYSVLCLMDLSVALISKFLRLSRAIYLWSGERAAFPTQSWPCLLPTNPHLTEFTTLQTLQSEQVGRPPHQQGRFKSCHGLIICCKYHQLCCRFACYSNSMRVSCLTRYIVEEGEFQRKEAVTFRDYCVQPSYRKSNPCRLVDLASYAESCPDPARQKTRGMDQGEPTESSK